MANDEVQSPDNLSRRRFLTATTAVVGAVGVGFVAVPFIKSWDPSARAKLAGAPTIRALDDIAEGQQVTVMWRGQPIFIARRTKPMLATLPGMHALVVAPASDNPCQTPEYA